MPTIIKNSRIFLVTMKYRTPYEDVQKTGTCLVWLNKNKLNPKYAQEDIKTMAYKKLCAYKGMKLGSIIIDDYNWRNVSDDCVII